MVVIGISGAIRGENTDGPDGPEIWEHVRSQGREGSVFYFDF